MREILEKRINWFVVVVTLIIFIFFIAIVLPKVSSYSDEVIGGLGTPDTSFFYNSDDLYRYAESYGVEGRRNYVFLRWTFDVIWPLVYLSFLLSLSVQLSKNLKSKWLNQLYWMPIIATGFDFLENILTSIIMINFSVKLYWLADFASVASLTKWILLCLAFISLIILGLANFLGLLRLRNNV